MAYTTSRNPFHDYHSAANYLVTIGKQASAPAFSRVCGGKDFPAPRPGVAYYPLGRSIANQLKALPAKFPDFSLEQYIIMPDHVHLVIDVHKRTDWHLGDLVANLKVAVNAETGLNDIFTDNYHDRILRKQDSLKVMINYVKSNPERFIIKKDHPEYFTNPQLLILWDKPYVCYGNFLLLRNPNRSCVKISRSYTAEQLNALTREWDETTRCNGVLISPFISKAEKAIFSREDEAGANFILITRDELRPRFKPQGKLFRLCAEGRLLIVSTNKEALGEKISRAEAVEMNELAARLAAEQLPEQLSLKPLRADEWKEAHLRQNAANASRKPRAEARPDEPRAKARPNEPRAEARPSFEREPHPSGRGERQQEGEQQGPESSPSFGGEQPGPESSPSLGGEQRGPESSGQHSFEKRAEL